ncbi:MAG TPA: dTDP-4-amino-4,6-dideoxygalactose transaminase [Humidesulfovibrio sp.]|uniref:dTDP-4-amino-4,6-dideoxygalactose transaminase n=1 Tax=Humidesulfovibrio sp. TaxID=2910988 RepID=UPI002B9429E4|nr:dTDP-4-amino-4,6-dideoxygalactose transaminase [Humidesulfovibrio sp.]HWR02661.1 dTDP-4-amino-4,6-dideoxygalactose transaminase [Humidesulfovibrio sp.]
MPGLGSSGEWVEAWRESFSLFNMVIHNGRQKVIVSSIPFNKPYMTGRELRYIEEAHLKGHLSGDGGFTRRCHDWLEAHTKSCKALLVHSCTGALELSAMLADIRAGDEVIMPSYTFVSTANAFILRGGVPVFVDIRQDTLNIDEELIEAAITPRTKAIVPVHYAGVPCEMDRIMAIAKKYSLIVIEDAAQGLMSSYESKPLGGIGHLATYSFHETKNIISGEGGALIINDDKFAERAEILREKGTNRNKFFRGQVDKYTWVDMGSSYLPSEITAAFLCAQMDEAESITQQRLDLWSRYHQLLEQAESSGTLRRPVVPDGCTHNAHMYYILLESLSKRTEVIAKLKENGIQAVFHYVPLHSSPFGLLHTRCSGSLQHTEELSERLLRLPLWVGLTEAQQNRIVEVVQSAL